MTTVGVVVAGGGDVVVDVVVEPDVCAVEVLVALELLTMVQG